MAPGYEAFNLIQMFGGQYGTDMNANPLAIGGTYIPVQTAVSASTGTFQFSTYLPLEFAKAYGVISSANASLLPTLQFNLNTAANFFGATQPSTAVTISLTVDQDFYWLPEGVAVEPPGIGTTCQWIYQPANPTIGSASTLNVQLRGLAGTCPRSSRSCATPPAPGRPPARARTADGVPGRGSWLTAFRLLILC